MIARLGDICEKKIDTIKAAYKGDIDYVDISSIDNQRKIITQIQSMSIEDAPSRAKQLVFPGDILVSTVRPNLNAVALITKNTDNALVASTGYCVLRCLPNADNKYVFYFCQSPTFIEKLVVQATGASYPAVTSAIIRECALPLPPLEEQRKIAAVLDKVSGLIAKRRQQLDKLDELVKSRFIEMFGDPVQNPFEWSTRPLLEMGYCKNGMNFHTGDHGIEMHCLGVGDFKDYSIIDGTNHLPIVSLNEVPPEESMLQDGDIVFVRSNGNKALVGRCLVVYPRNTPTIYSGFCIRYRLTSKEVNRIYLLRVLKTDSMRERMMGRGANIQNLNQQIIATLDIPMPPLELQEQFATFVEQIDKLKCAIQKNFEKLKTLKNALMQEYFG